MTLFIPTESVPAAAMHENAPKPVTDKHIKPLVPGLKTGQDEFVMPKALPVVESKNKPARDFVGYGYGYGGF